MKMSEINRLKELRELFFEKSKKAARPSSFIWAVKQYDFEIERLIKRG